MSTRAGFTLVEVAIAGSLIGLCVLTAVSIIPSGMQVQNRARMRAVAAATVAYIAAESLGYSTITNSRFMAASTVTSSSVTFLGDRASVPNPTGTIYCLDGISANSGRLERRIIYSTVNGTSGKEINAWLLNKDPANSPTKAEYLATFVEAL
jgi:Tfp pilus assembly protein PilE